MDSSSPKSKISFLLGFFANKSWEIELVAVGNITAEDLNITTKHDLLAVEGLFVQHLKPIVYSE